MSDFADERPARTSVFWRLALLCGAMALSGCAVMMKSDAGALEGMEFAGYPGKAGKDDFAIVAKTVGVRFLTWHIASGSIQWVDEDEDVYGYMTFENDCTQDKFMELMEAISRHYNADLTYYEYDDAEPFRVGTAPTDWANVPFWLVYWFFPTHEVGCSAIFRMRETALDDVAEGDVTEIEF